MMYLPKAKVIKRTISLEYTCPTLNKTTTEKIVSPRIYQSEYYEDWQYDAIDLKCKLCGKDHTFEI